MQSVYTLHAKEEPTSQLIVGHSWVDYSEGLGAGTVERVKGITGGRSQEMAG